MESKEDKDDRDERDDEDEQDGSGEDDENEISEPAVETMDEDEFDFSAIDALRDHRKKGTGLLDKLALDAKPLPKEEDVVERARIFQRNRKARAPWKPGQSYFTIPEANENVSSDEEDEAFSSLLNQHRDYVKAQPALKSPTQTETFAEIGARGANFMKYGRHGKPHIKIVRVDAATGKLSYGTGSLALQDATDIVAGKNTKVFEGVKHKYAHPSVCFSIILRNRTLDLRATNEEERDRWLKGLKALKKELDSKADEDSDEEDEAAMEKSRRNEEVSMARAKDTAVAFRAIATAGVPVKKYTRHGAAHERILKLNFNTGTLDWQTGTISLLNVTSINPGTATNKHPAGTPGGEKCFSIQSPGRTVDFKVASLLSRNMWISGLMEVLASTQQQVRSRSESESSTVKLFSECAVEGTPLLKYGKHGAPKKKLVKVDLNTGNVSWGTGFLNLADASAIVASDATQRTSLMYSIKRQNPKHGFSIIMANRQVDLEANSETERDLWVQGLKNLHRKLELETVDGVKMEDDEDDSFNSPRIQSEQLKHGKIGDKSKMKKTIAPTKRKKKSLILAVTSLEKQVQSLQAEHKRIQHQNKSLEDHVAQLHSKYGLPPFVVTPQSPPSSPVLTATPKLSAAGSSHPHSPLERQSGDRNSDKQSGGDRNLDRKAPPPPPSSPAPAHLSLHIPEVSPSPLGASPSASSVSSSMLSSSAPLSPSVLSSSPFSSSALSDRDLDLPYSPL